MNSGSSGTLATLGEVVAQFGLTALEPALRACRALAAGEPLAVAVLGQFKAGKSSLLNAVLGEAVFPVGAVPVTAVVTRAAAGPRRAARVTYADGRTEDVDPDRLAEFVTEAGNPGNRRGVALVDVETPALGGLPGIRLVDTPGLGSALAHNTEATRAWLPNAAVALVVVGAERPLAEEDRRLLDEARRIAPRVVVVLSKVDLLTGPERQEVTAYLDRSLRDWFPAGVQLLPFSTRADVAEHVRRLREAVLEPVAGNAARERAAALALKASALAEACRGYLAVGLAAAERADADRDRLRRAVLEEGANATLIRDELRLARERVAGESRPALEELCLGHRTAVTARVAAALAAEAPGWRGNLAAQARRYETWLAERLRAELAPVSAAASCLAATWVEQGEVRLRRVVEAFRDRLGRNVRAALGVAIPPVAWAAERPALATVPVALGHTFTTRWDLLWWLLPMWLVGGLFRRSLSRRVPWEVEKNLHRLAADWAEAVARGVAALHVQAVAWVEAERATLDRLLGEQAPAAAAYRAALARLEGRPAPGP